MHELSLMADLMAKIDRVARDQGASRVAAVKVTLGALSHLSPAHFREHFEHASAGTISEGAELDIVVATDIHDPLAQDIVLHSVEVEVDDDDLDADVDTVAAAIAAAAAEAVAAAASAAATEADTEAAAVAQADADTDAER